MCPPGVGGVPSSQRNPNHPHRALPHRGEIPHQERPALSPPMEFPHSQHSLTSPALPFSQCGWYWGPMNWEDAEMKLKGKPDGSFLVRDSSDPRYILSLSFRSQGITHHTRMEHYRGEGIPSGSGNLRDAAPSSRTRRGEAKFPRGFFSLKTRARLWGVCASERWKKMGIKSSRCLGGWGLKDFRDAGMGCAASPGGKISQH